MRELTLESGACPACNAENSKHIDNCHACGQQLPWAGEEDKRQKNLQAASQLSAKGRALKTGEQAIVVAAGALIFVFGIVLWCGNVFGFLPAFPGARYITILVGIAIFKWGNYS